MRARAEGRIEATDNFLAHIERCLLCRNCEAVCPSGVPYGRIMQAERASLAEDHPVQHTQERALRWAVFRWLLLEPARLAPLAAALRLYQKTGLQGALRRTGLAKRLPGPLGRMEALLPRLPETGFGLTPTVVPANGTARGRVGLFAGCVMPLLYGDVNAATARVLARNGYDVVVVAGQTCCGSLHEHSGERRTAQQLARRNIEVFLAAGVDAVVVNAAGCGATLKEYGELLADDPVFAGKARRFSERVYDISEYLAMIDLEPPAGSISAIATYQDSCHLAHAQRITVQPRKLLRSIPGLRLVEMRASDRCCGSAGIYSITQPELSGRLLAGKMGDVADTGADLLVTANPGCMLQLSLGVQQSGLPIRVAHVVELLDWAYRTSYDQRPPRDPSPGRERAPA